MKSALVKCVLWLCCFGFVITQQPAVEHCTTPNGQSGNCISVTQCKNLRDKFDNLPKPLPSGLLQSYHCGFDVAAAKVCCPTHPEPITTPVYQTPVYQAPVYQTQGNAVRAHRNAHLINQYNCGGKVQASLSFPWMTQLVYNSTQGTSTRCGGSLINENYILTAAHCVANLKGFQLAGVRLGEYDTNTNIDCLPTGICLPPVQDIIVSEVIVHPEYDSQQIINDIALLRLAVPANVSSESVKPVCLSTDVGHLPVELIVTGWGVTETGVPSNKLLKVYLPSVPNDECQARYDQIKRKMRIGAGQLCAGGEGGRDSCSGDGGGPTGNHDRDNIFVQYGIISYGSRFCGVAGDSLPGVNTRVAYYMNWILDSIRP